MVRMDEMTFGLEIVRAMSTHRQTDRYGKSIHVSKENLANGFWWYLKKANV